MNELKKETVIGLYDVSLDTGDNSLFIEQINSCCCNGLSLTGYEVERLIKFYNENKKDLK